MENLDEFKDIYKFVEKHVEGPWNKKFEYVLYHTPETRFVITIERSASPYAQGCWRADVLAENGISDSEIDSDEFARKFADDVAHHLSPRDVMSLMAYLQVYLDRWMDMRASVNAPPYDTAAEIREIYDRIKK